MKRKLQKCCPGKDGPSVILHKLIDSYGLFPSVLITDAEERRECLCVLVLVLLLLQHNFIGCQDLNPQLGTVSNALNALASHHSFSNITSGGLSKTYKGIPFPLCVPFPIPFLLSLLFTSPYPHLSLFPSYPPLNLPFICPHIFFSFFLTKGAHSSLYHYLCSISAS